MFVGRMVGCGLCTPLFDHASLHVLALLRFWTRKEPAPKGKTHDMVEAVKRLVEERVLVHEQAEDPSLFRDRHMFCIEVWWQRNAGRGVWV